ncbi:MAG: hypothetical protein ACI32O_11510 [Enterococcus sp.]|nr:hypothetical protein [Enterococcus sp. 10A9_DIV0425]
MERGSVPLVLSRMNLALSNVMRKDETHLTDSQLATFKKLTALSNIRYGY